MLQKLKLNQNGFGVTEGLLVLVIVAIIGGAGFYVYSVNKDTNKRLNNTGNSEVTNKEKKKETTQPSVTNNTEGYLVIKEWGVKVKIRDSNKLAYTYSGEAGTNPSSITYDSTVKPVVKPEHLQNKTCTAGVVIARSKTVPGSEADTVYWKKIGNDFYSVNGSPGRCSDNPDTNPDDQLIDRVRQDLQPVNMEAL